MLRGPSPPKTTPAAAPGAGSRSTASLLLPPTPPRSPAFTQQLLSGPNHPLRKHRFCPRSVWGLFSPATTPSQVGWRNTGQKRAVYLRSSRGCLRHRVGLTPRIAHRQRAEDEAPSLPTLTHFSIKTFPEESHRGTRTEQIAHGRPVPGPPPDLSSPASLGCSGSASAGGVGRASSWESRARPQHVGSRQRPSARRMGHASGLIREPTQPHSWPGPAHVAR